MKGEFQVRYTDAARGDLLQLFDFLVDRAQTVEDFEGHLSRSPFIFRKAGQSPFLRELVIAFGNSGYVALYEIQDTKNVNVLAVRHQLEDDYY